MYCTIDVLRFITFENIDNVPDILQHMRSFKKTKLFEKTM